MRRCGINAAGTRRLHAAIVLVSLTFAAAGVPHRVERTAARFAAATQRTGAFQRIEARLGGGGVAMLLRLLVCFRFAVERIEGRRRSSAQKTAAAAARLARQGAAAVACNDRRHIER